MSRPAGIDIFEDRALRKEQYDLQLPQEKNYYNYKDQELNYHQN